MRNFVGSQRAATGFKAAGFKLTGPRAASFTVRCFGEAAGFAKVACLRHVTCFGDLACFADLACFDELLKTSDSQPASLTSIGRSAIAAKAAMMVRRRGRNPEAILPRTQMNSRRFMLAPPKAIIAAEIAIPEGGGDVDFRSLGAWVQPWGC